MHPQRYIRYICTIPVLKKMRDLKYTMSIVSRIDPHSPPAMVDWWPAQVSIRTRSTSAMNMAALFSWCISTRPFDFIFSVGRDANLISVQHITTSCVVCFFWVITWTYYIYYLWYLISLNHATMQLRNCSEISEPPGRRKTLAQRACKGKMVLDVSYCYRYSLPHMAKIMKTQKVTLAKISRHGI